MSFFRRSEKGSFLRIRPEELNQAAQAAGGADIVVDALFGTGLTREISGLYKEAVSIINGMRAYKVSVDIPSGVSGDTGAVMGGAVRADATVTFQYPKIGHFLYPGKEYAGELTVARIGVDKNCPVLDELDVRVYGEREDGVGFVRRHSDTNKGDYGRAADNRGQRGHGGRRCSLFTRGVQGGSGDREPCIHRLRGKRCAEKRTRGRMPDASRRDGFHHQERRL